MYYFKGNNKVHIHPNDAVYIGNKCHSGNELEGRVYIGSDKVYVDGDTCAIVTDAQYFGKTIAASELIALQRIGRIAAPSTIVPIDIALISKKMLDRGFDGVEMDGWTNDLMDIIEDIYRIESKVSATLRTLTEEKVKKEAIKLVEKMSEAMKNLNAFWQELDADQSDKLNNLLMVGFPFLDCFSDVCYRVQDWSDNLSNGVTQPDTTTKHEPLPEPMFLWKDKTGRGLTNTLPLGVIRADTTTDTNYDGKKLRKWAKNAEIGEVWENESEHYTRIS